MMIARFRPEKRTVQHVGPERDRMPVGRNDGLKGPEKALPGEPFQDLGIFRHVGLVVEVIEGETADLPVNHEGGGKEQNGDKNEAVPCKKGFILRTLICHGWIINLKAGMNQ